MTCLERARKGATPLHKGWERKETIYMQLRTQILSFMPPLKNRLSEKQKEKKRKETNKQSDLIVHSPTISPSPSWVVKGIPTYATKKDQCFYYFNSFSCIGNLQSNQKMIIDRHQSYKSSFLKIKHHFEYCIHRKNWNLERFFVQIKLLNNTNSLLKFVGSLQVL